MATACARLRACSLASRWRTCDLTVSSERKRRWPISRLTRPSATSCSTSSSRIGGANGITSALPLERRAAAASKRRLWSRYRLMISSRSAASTCRTSAPRRTRFSSNEVIRSGFEADESTAILLQRRRFLLLDDHAAAGRMEDAPVTEPEGDVRHGLFAVDGEIPVLRLGDGLARSRLLVRIARYEPTEPAPCHVDEPRAVDSV